MLDAYLEKNKMKIYALLIGIDKYPRKPLSQCVSDSIQIESYLNKLQDEPYSREIIVKALRDDAAKKGEIVRDIVNFLGQATDEDVAMLYYSGHGAHEDAKGRFSDEHDNLLECIVCHYDKEQSSGYLLADKEIRYLLSRLPHNPHLLTVFDCCHAGDMVRAGGEEEEGEIKRLSGFFKARDYKEFVFSENISEENLKTKPLGEILPFKNHVHIAACSADESSWENKRGGVFTRYLLELLTASANKLNYQEIARWAKISLKGITQKIQTPTISEQGEGKLKVHSYSPWLLLHGKDELRDSPSLIYNHREGWKLTVGQIMGIKKEALISLPLDNKTHKLKVVEADLATSLVEDPKIKGIILDKKSKYPVRLETTSIYDTLSLFVHDLDNKPEKKTQIEAILKKQDQVALTNSGEAHFFVNLFNDLVYFSLNGNPYRPLAKQINLLDGNIDLEAVLQNQLQYLVKWNHFNTLENPGVDFDKAPIKVELKIHGEDQWQDVSNKTCTLAPKKQRRDKKDEDGNIVEQFWMQAFQVKVTNITDNDLYIGVLSLGSDLGISSNPWQKQVIKLNPGAFKLFYDHRKQHYASASIDMYKEVYNWKDEWFHYKFIVNNFSDFTTALGDYLQANLEHPFVLSKITKEIESAKSEDAFDFWEEVEDAWGTLKTTIRLANPEYNIVSADLKELQEFYLNSKELGPFIHKLYPNDLEN